MLGPEVGVGGVGEIKGESAVCGRRPDRSL